jgi:hypothetical protein
MPANLLPVMRVVKRYVTISNPILAKNGKIL